MSISVSSLYDFNSNSGIVLADTDDVRTEVNALMRSIFGADIDLTESTHVGCLASAITSMVTQFAGVTALNASGINPNNAVGIQLDNIGSLFGTVRNSNETDDSYRKRLITSNSRGTGYVQSIKNELSKISELSTYTVYENGHSYPISVYGISVSPHSIFVSVHYDASDMSEEEITDLDSEIANAIYKTKSAGCGYTESDNVGTVKSVDITDSATGSVNTVKFYKAAPYYLKIVVDASITTYTGSDLANYIKSTLIANLNGKMGASISDEKVSSIITNEVKGIEVKNITLYTKDTSSSTWIEITQYTNVSPSKYISLYDDGSSVSNIIVNIA